MTNWNSIHDWRIKFTRGDYNTVSEQENARTSFGLFVPKVSIGQAIFELEDNGISYEEDNRGCIVFSSLESFTDAEFLLSLRDIDFSMEEEPALALQEVYSKGDLLI